MARIEYRNDRTRATEEVEGSDGRLNVSSRTDGRAYYVSRDQGQCYTLAYEHLLPETGEISFSLQNTSTDKTLVVSSVGVNSQDGGRFKLFFPPTAATSGTAIVPQNLNRDSSNDAQAVAFHHSSTIIAGFTATSGLVPVDDLIVGALGHEEFRLSDRVRLGQNDSIVMESTTVVGTPGVLVHGVVFFYFE